MLFNSIEFAIFLPVVFSIYWLIPKQRIALRNLLLLAASYLFYGWWDWRFLSLIMLSSLVDFIVGIQLERCLHVARRKWLLVLSMTVNIGMLAIFKYFNFFLDSLEQAFTLFGVAISGERLAIVLPVGISFYTFQTMSYSIDVYRRKIPATKDPLAFFTFVTFFPQLVAGPIERASHLLPQFSSKKHFQYDAATDGLRQILWGLFKKMVIADNCAVVVNAVFADPAGFSASTLVLAAVLFAFQIYCDFSGYSDIAIGTSRLFGFNLKQNFAYPYFSRDIAEFWRRWHISLSSWFRDYLYIPLGGSRGTLPVVLRNTFIVFLVSGLWHGANWTFVFWGLLHAIYFLPLLLTRKNRRYVEEIESTFPSIQNILRMLSTFILVDIAWIFFRANSVAEAFLYLKSIFSPTLLSIPEFLPVVPIAAIIFMLGMEWLNRHEAHGLALQKRGLPLALRYGGYLGLSLVFWLFGGASESFIYFQF